MDKLMKERIENYISKMEVEIPRIEKIRNKLCDGKKLNEGEKLTVLIALFFYEDFCKKEIEEMTEKLKEEG